jgi:hypothetical protein
MKPRVRYAALLRTIRGSLAFLVAAIALAVASTALAVPITAPVTNGDCLAPSGLYCVVRTQVSGTFSIQRFALRDGQIVAEGVVVNATYKVFPYSYFSTTIFPSAAPLTLPVVGISASCSSSTATLTLKGSEPPPSALNLYEPFPDIFVFEISYQFPNEPRGTTTDRVGLLPTTATVDGNRGLVCALSRLAPIPQAKRGVVAVLNALLLVPK